MRGICEPTAALSRIAAELSRRLNGLQRPPRHKEANRGSGPIRRFIQNRHGATSIEYAMIAMLVAAVIVGAVTLVGEKMNVVWSRVATSL